MLYRSKQWARIAARGEFRVDAKLVVSSGNTLKEYFDITAPIIDRQTMATPLSFGNCSTATLTASVLTEDEIPSGASIEVKARLMNEKGRSEWRSFGTFYIDHRTKSENGLIELSCYDAMMKAEQKYVADDNYNTLGWPKPMSEVVGAIADRLGVPVDARTTIKSGNAYMVDFPKEYTLKQVLCFIAAVHGGNWVITGDNELYLVPCVARPADSWNIIDRDYNSIVTRQGHNLVWKHGEVETENGANIGVFAPVPIRNSFSNSYGILSKTGEQVVTSDGYRLIWASGSEAYAVGGLLNIPVVIGTLNTGKTLTVTKVTMTNEQKESFSAGEDSGFEVVIKDNPYASATACNDLLNDLYGVEYAPYTASNAVFDPAFEIGDQIRIGDTVRSVIYNMKLTLDVGFSADLVTPASQEQTSEYPYLTELQKLKDEDDRIIKYVDETQVTLESHITRTNTQIELEVSRAQGAEEAIAAQVQLKVDKSDNGQIISMINASADRITLTAGRLVITSGNFQLDASGNVTINNGNFKGVIETGVDSDNFGIKLDRGELSITQRGTKYLRILPSDWGKGSNPNAPFGAQIRAESFLAFNDMSGGMYAAINMGANPNGFTRGFLVFTDADFTQDVHIGWNRTLYLGSNEVTFNGAFVEFDCGVHASNFTFDSAPLSGTNARSLESILQWIENQL